MAPIPGWYDDPTASGRLRWWDGDAWTDRTRSAAQVPPAPAPDDEGVDQDVDATDDPVDEAPEAEDHDFDLPPGGEDRVTLPGGDPFDLRGTKFRILIGILVAATLGLLVAVALAGFGRGNVFELEVGDCFDGEGLVARSSGDAQEISDVQVVPCTDAHDNEVFDAFDIPGDEFPGTASMRDLAVDGCVDRFRAVVGYPMDLTDLDVSAFWPTEASWGEGDREVLCTLFRFDGSKLVGSRIDLAAERGQEEFRLQQGDCFDAPLREPEAGQDVAGVALVDCSRAHFAEVYEVATLPAGTYPGRDALAAAAQELCHAAFEPFVGEPFEDSAVLWFNALPPTESSWGAGDRDVVCYVYDLVNGQIVGPAPQWAQAQRAAAADFGAGYDVSFLEVGDCFDDPVGDEVPPVECSEPHDNEAFLAFDLDGEAWPGRAQLEAEVTAACAEAFEEWVGPDRDDLAWFPFQPTEDTWSDGDRRVVCALYDIDFLKLTGSQKRAAV